MYELYPLFCTLHGIFCYLEDSCGTEDPEPHHVTLLNIAAYWPYPVCVQDTQNKKLSERQNHPGVIHVKVIYWHVPGNMLPSLSNQQGGKLLSSGNILIFADACNWGILDTGLIIIKKLIRVWGVSYVQLISQHTYQCTWITSTHSRHW